MKRVVTCVGAVFLALVLAGAAGAAQRNDVQSCRKAFVKRTLPAERAIFVLIDETLQLDERLKRDTTERILLAVRPGDRVVLAVFSAFRNSDYTKVQFDGQVETPFSNTELENDVPARKVRLAQQCFKDQERYARGKIETMLRQTLSTKTNRRARSEILLSLVDLARELIAPEGAAEKRIVIVSDMLENSDITSFYSARQLRLIDPQAELIKVRDREMLAALDRANVYVVGAALLPALDGGGRGARERVSLQRFWRSWIEASGAALVAWGEPELKRAIE